MLTDFQNSFTGRLTGKFATNNNNNNTNDRLTAFDPGQHSPTHTHPDHRASFIIFLHLQRSMASSLFNLRA